MRIRSTLAGEKPFLRTRFDFKTGNIGALWCHKRVLLLEKRGRVCDGCGIKLKWRRNLLTQIRNHSKSLSLGTSEYKEAQFHTRRYHICNKRLHLICENCRKFFQNDRLIFQDIFGTHPWVCPTPMGGYPYVSLTQTAGEINQKIKGHHEDNAKPRMVLKKQGCCIMMIGKTGIRLIKPLSLLKTDDTAPEDENNEDINDI